MGGKFAGREVAMDVLQAVRKGEKPNLQKIQLKHGYTKNSAKAMRATLTKGYKETISSVVEGLEKERNRLIRALSKRDLSNEKYKDMMDGVDKLTKNIQLLNGGATERQSLAINFDESFNG